MLPKAVPGKSRGLTTVDRASQEGVDAGQILFDDEIDASGFDPVDEL
ncbi:MAG: hypothetical protein ABEI57_02515 [Halapricum sp.]